MRETEPSPIDPTAQKNPIDSKKTNTKRVPNPYPKSKHPNRKSGNTVNKGIQKKPGCGKCWTVEEFAIFFDVHLNTVRNWIKKGKIQAIKISNYYRIPDSFVVDLISGNLLESLK